MAGLAAALRDEARHLAPVRVLVAVGAAGGREVERHAAALAARRDAPGRWHWSQATARCAPASG